MEKFLAVGKYVHPHELATSVKGSLISLLDYLKELVGKVNVKEPGKESLAGVVLILIGGHLYYWQKYRFWSNKNIKTPPVLPIVGNSLDFVFKPKLHLFNQWVQKYGRLHGYYSGTKPILVCADAAILKKICIKDFDKFPNRYFVGHKNKYQRNVLVALDDDHWRSVRAITSPTFSSGKMKIIFKLLKSCTNDLIESHERALREQGGTEAIVETKKIYGLFSIASSMASFYGIKLEPDSKDKSNTNTAENFIQLTKRAVTLRLHRLLISTFLPEFLIKLIHYPLFADDQMSPLAERAQRIVEHRQKNPNQKANDFLQLLLDAKASNEIEVAECDKFESHHALEVDQLKNKTGRYKLTDEEVYCNAMAFIFVATETTSSLMSHTIYLLAHHQEVQEKLYQELLRIKTDDDEEFHYDAISSCIYLDCVVSESLRIMPPAINLDRIANEDYYVEEYDLLIPRGTTIILAFSAILNDPEYWPQPEVFDPDRFSPENKGKIIPGSYCPFGIGPRACIGFRFALTEAKLALARILTRYRLEVAPGTKYPAEPCKNTFAINELKNLKVMVKRR